MSQQPYSGKRALGESRGGGNSDISKEGRENIEGKISACGVWSRFDDGKIDFTPPPPRSQCEHEANSPLRKCRRNGRRREPLRDRRREKSDDSEKKNLIHVVRMPLFRPSFFSPSSRVCEKKTVLFGLFFRPLSIWIARPTFSPSTCVDE